MNEARETPATREEIVTGLRRLAEYGPYWSCAAGADLLEADAAKIAHYEGTDAKSWIQDELELRREIATLKEQADPYRNLLDIEVRDRRIAELEALVREVVEWHAQPRVAVKVDAWNVPQVARMLDELNAIAIRASSLLKDGVAK